MVHANEQNSVISAPGERVKELEAENARSRKQRDAANAQLDSLIEEVKK